jgi:hypothetical protein
MLGRRLTYSHIGKQLHQARFDRIKSDANTSTFWLTLPQKSTIKGILCYKPLASSVEANVTIHIESGNALQRYNVKTKEFNTINLETINGGVIPCVINSPSVTKLVVYFEA